MNDVRIFYIKKLYNKKWRQKEKTRRDSVISDVIKRNKEKEKKCYKKYFSKQYYKIVNLLYEYLNSCVISYTCHVAIRIIVSYACLLYDYCISLSSAILHQICGHIISPGVNIYWYLCDTLSFSFSDVHFTYYLASSWKKMSTISNYLSLSLFVQLFYIYLSFIYISKLEFNNFLKRNC